jgi:hypothetical protein
MNSETANVSATEALRSPTKRRNRTEQRTAAGECMADLLIRIGILGEPVGEIFQSVAKA